MSVEGRLVATVNRLWDKHGRTARGDFLVAHARGEESTHYLYDWETLLAAVGSQRRFDELQAFFALVRLGELSEAEDMDLEYREPNPQAAGEEAAAEEEEADEEDEAAAEE